MDLSHRFPFQSLRNTTCAKYRYDIKKTPYEGKPPTELKRNLTYANLTNKCSVNPREEDQSLARISQCKKRIKPVNNENYLKYSSLSTERGSSRSSHKSERIMNYSSLNQVRHEIRNSVFIPRELTTLNPGSPMKYEKPKSRPRDNLKPLPRSRDNLKPLPRSRDNLKPSTQELS